MKTAATEDNATSPRFLIGGPPTTISAKAVDISKYRVGHILYEVLSMRKLSSRR